MWFDSQAALANIKGGEPLLLEPDCRATCATSATSATHDPATLPYVAHVAHVARSLSPKAKSVISRDDGTETFEERVAVCQIEGGLPRAEAEALALLHLPGFAEEAGVDDATMARVIDVAARRFDQLQKKVRA